MTCTYRFIGTNGKQTVLKGQAAFKAFLVDGGLEQLRGEAAPKFSGRQANVLDRIPALETAAQGVKEGTVTREQYSKLVNKLKPVTPYAEVPTPATVADMQRGLTSDKVERIGVPSETLKAGDPVGLRLDIPAYSNNGVWVVSIHEQAAGYSAGKSIGYESVAAVTKPTFGVVEKAALAIAGGKPKATIAVMKGDWKPITPKQASTTAKAALKSEKWVQVGMDPTRHAYFYDRENMEPVVSADEAVQIGPLVLAKNPVYGKKSDFAFSKRQELRDAADAIAKMDPEVRDDTMIGDFPGAADGYMLYEARVLLKKPSEKLKRVNENNSFELWNRYDYVANVDGELFGVTKQEDPDETDDETKFVYSFAPLDDPFKDVTTTTDQTDELFKEMRASLGAADTNSPFTVAFSTRQQAPNTWPNIEEPDGSEAKPGEPITVLRLASMEGLDNVNAASLEGLYSYLSMIDDNETGAGSEAAESDTIYAYKVTVPANGFGDYRLMGKGKTKTDEAAAEAGRQKAKYGGYWYSFPQGTEAELLGSIPLADARKAAAKAERAAADKAPWRKSPVTNEEAAKLKGNFDFIGTDAGTEALRQALGLSFSRRQTNTPEFKRFFKDSKVVDENGQPMVVYHTGLVDTDELISGAEVQRRLGKEPIYANEGVYFTADPLYSAQYGRNREGAIMYPVYLSIQNPLVITDKKELTLLEKLKRVFLSDKAREDAELSDTTDRLVSMYITEKYKAELIKKGYDGIINKAYNEIVVFEPTQIKSATGNVGTFDATNPDIRFSRQQDIGAALEDRVDNDFDALVKSTTGLMVPMAARCWTPTSHASCRLNTKLIVHAQAKCMRPSANSSTSFIKSGSRTPALMASSCSWPAVVGQASPAQVNCWPTYSRQPTSFTTVPCPPTARPRDAFKRRLMQVRTCTSPTSTANP
jgi:hypothetical protein